MSQAPTERDLHQLPELNDTKAEADRLTAANEQLKKEIAERSGAEDRIRLIIDTIPVMAWSVRPDGIVDFLNQRWMDYTGLSLGQYVADPTGPIHPEDTPRILERWRAQMAREAGYEDDMRLRAADGTYRQFLVRNRTVAG
jgi:PAS domain S-box-containing protein